MASQWIREAAHSPELSASSQRPSGSGSSRGKRPYTPLFLDIDDGTEFGAATSTPRPFQYSSQGAGRRGAASTSKKPHAVQTTLHRHLDKQPQGQGQQQRTPSRMPLGERSSNVLVAYGATPSQKQQKKPRSAEPRVKASIGSSSTKVRGHDHSSWFGHPSPSLLRSDAPSPSQLDLRNVFGPAPPSSLVGRGNSPLVIGERPNQRLREDRGRSNGHGGSMVDLSRSSEDEDESRRTGILDDGKRPLMSPPQLPSIRSPRSKRRIYALETQVSSSQDLKEEMKEIDTAEDDEGSSPLSSPPPETPSKQKASPRPKPSQASSTTEPGASFQSDGSRRSDGKRSTEERPQLMNTDLLTSPTRQSRSPELCSSEEDTLPFFDETYHDPGSDEDDIVLTGEPSRHQPPRSAKKTATEQQQSAHQESPKSKDERKEEKEEEEEESETQLLPWEGEDHREERSKKRPSAWMDIEKGWSGVDLSAKVSSTAAASAATQTRASQTTTSNAEQGLLDRYGFTQHRQKRRRAPLLDDEASQRYEVEEDEHPPKQPPSSGQSRTQEEEQTNEDDVVPSIIPDMADLDTQARRWLFQEDF